MFPFSSFFSSTPNLPAKGLKSNDDLLVSNKINSNLPRFSSSIIDSPPLLPVNSESNLIEPDEKSLSSPSSPSSLSSSSLSSLSSPTTTTTTSSQSTQLSLSSSSLSLCSPLPKSITTNQSSGSVSPSTPSTRIVPTTRSSSSFSSVSSTTPTTTTPSSLSPVSDFTKFEEKRRNQAEKQHKTLRSVLRNTAQRFGLRERISSSSTSSTSSSPSPTTTPTAARSKGKNFLRLESFPLSYGDFYNSLGSVVPSWGGNSGNGSTATSIEDGPLEDIQRQVNLIAEQLNEMKTVDQMSSTVNQFYQSMLNRFENLPIFKEIVQVSVEQLIDYTEIRLLSCMWNTFFNQILIEDERKDLQLQNQIRNLNWITTDHLELDLDLTKPEICDYMDQAIGHIVEMGSKGIPLQKLECIVNCSKALLQLLNLSREGEPVSADLFLPAFVYTVIQANPPLLHSNIKLINQFSSPNRLSSGEASYYFTNLCCAVAFIEKLNGESLNLPEEEFRRYINGDERPNNGYNDQLQFNNRLSEAFRRMNSNNNLIASLSPKQSALEEEIDQLKKTIKVQQESIISQLQSLTESLVLSSTINTQTHELRKNVFKSRVTQSPFYYELNRT